MAESNFNFSEGQRYEETLPFWPKVTNFDQLTLEATMRLWIKHIGDFKEKAESDNRESR